MGNWSRCICTMYNFRGIMDIEVLPSLEIFSLLLLTDLTMLSLVLLIVHMVNVIEHVLNSP